MHVLPFYALFLVLYWCFERQTWNAMFPTQNHAAHHNAFCWSDYVRFPKCNVQKEHGRPQEKNETGFISWKLTWINLWGLPTTSSSKSLILQNSEINACGKSQVWQDAASVNTAQVSAVFCHESCFNVNVSVASMYVQEDASLHFAFRNISCDLSILGISSSHKKDASHQNLNINLAYHG